MKIEPNDFERIFWEQQQQNKLLKVINIKYPHIAHIFYGQTKTELGIILWEANNLGLPTAQNFFIPYIMWQDYIFTFVDNPFPVSIKWHITASLFSQVFEARIPTLTDEILLKLSIEKIPQTARFQHKVSGYLPPLFLEDNQYYPHIANVVKYTGMIHAELQNMGNRLAHYMSQLNHDASAQVYVSSYHIFKTLVQYGELTNEIVDDLARWHNLNATQIDLLSQVIPLYFVFGDNIDNVVTPPEAEYDLQKLIERGILFDNGRFDPSSHINVPPSENLPFVPFTF